MTGRNAAALPKATARLSQQLREVMINTLHPHRQSSCLWCPAGGGELPAEPCCLPACLPAKAGGSKPVQQRQLQKGLAAALHPCRRLQWEWMPPPPRDAGKGGEPRTHLRVPMGRGACGERGSSAWVHAGAGCHPSCANVPLQLFGTRHLHRSHPAPRKACSPSHTAGGLCCMVKPPRAPAWRAVPFLHPEGRDGQWVGKGTAGSPVLEGSWGRCGGEGCLPRAAGVAPPRRAHW